MIQNKIEAVLQACREIIGLKKIGKLIDCGDTGCVFRLSGQKVLKIGQQWLEYAMALRLMSETIHASFPKISKVIDLRSCHRGKDQADSQFYALVREDIADADYVDEGWFDEITADFEFQLERVSCANEDNIYMMSAEILEKRPGIVEDELLFEKLVDFYVFCCKKDIYLTDMKASNFGQRRDGTLVIRDLGGVHLGKPKYRRNPDFQRGRIHRIRGRMIELRASEFIFPPPPIQPGEARVTRDYSAQELANTRYYLSVRAMDYVSDPAEVYNFEREVPRELIPAYDVIFQVIDGKLATPELEDWKQNRAKSMYTDIAHFLNYRPAMQHEVDAFMIIAKKQWPSIFA